MGGNGTGTENYQFLFNDASPIMVSAAQGSSLTQQDFSGHPQDFLLYQDIPNTRAYVGGAIIVEATQTSQTRTVSLRITGLTSGAVAYMNLTVNNNRRQLSGA